MNTAFAKKVICAGLLSTLASAQAFAADGSVIYQNGASQSEAPQVIYDDTNHRLGIGKNPNVSLDVVGDNGGGATIQIRENNPSGYAGMEFQDTAGDFAAFFGYSNGNNHLRLNAKSGAYIAFMNNSVEQMRVSSDGKVGIGINNPTNALDVNGTVHAKEILVDLNGWPDYVFEDGYELRPLNEVAAYISDNGHLPDVPSAKDVHEKGVNLGQMDANLLRKIEELTLYMIELEKTNVALSNELNSLKKVVAEIEGK